MTVTSPSPGAVLSAHALQVDHRSDIYSLGLILHEMLSGRPVFAGESVTSLLVAQVTMMPPPIQIHAPDVPLTLADLIMRMLAKDPFSRPGSAAEVAELLAAMEGSLVPSEEPSFVPAPAAPLPAVLVITRTLPAPSSAAGPSSNTFTGHGRWLKPVLILGAIGTILVVAALVIAGLGVGSLLHKFGVG